ncbi:MAG: benzoyl-CoA reductase, bzd-type, O subunit [Dehalococcoidia bacterium]|nr:benzoyl-CoA reductase, bzd-type, O subunit [Dehalococcoidia bacterium]MBF8304145.1 benzoyl-CoA reductase, bzd-type, subunit [Dehalococcoidia bacterium]
MNNTKYETKPIEIWPKMKELRRWHFKHTWETAAKGGTVIMGMPEALLGFLAGLGDYAYPSYGPYFTRMIKDVSATIECLETVEAHGHTKDMCSVMRVYIGQLYMGLATKSPQGSTIKPKFIFQVTNCHTMAQTGQLFSDYLGIPYLSIDLPYKSTPQARKYVVNQLLEGIEWMEKVTGKKYDDEKLIEGVKTEWKVEWLWAAIQMQTQNIPSPYDLRNTWSLRMPLLSMRERPETLQYLEALYDETKWRVANQISARGMERMRLFFEGFPPYYYIQILKQPEQYGCIYVINENNLGHGLWDIRPDGTYLVGQPLEKTGLPIRNREEAIEAEVELAFHRGRTSTWYSAPRHHEVVKRAKDWKCEAGVIALDRGCHGYQVSIMESKKALQEAGFPVGTFEHSQSDPREFSEAQTVDRMESFFESLGLEKLAGCGPEKAEADE